VDDSLDPRTHPSQEERAALGRAARAATPRSSHAGWSPPEDRPDPVSLLQEQAKSRVPGLVPIRHARMLISPFSYFRGAALPMASDLAHTPVSGLPAQLCGDAHLSNFGIFASPERHLVFDVNDFDETHPGPWEWDVKRLAASLEVAARDAGFDDTERRRIVQESARSYRETMRAFAERSMLATWYEHLDLESLVPRFEAMLDPHRTPAVWHAIEKARAHDSVQAYERLTHLVDGEPRIISDPPLLVPVEQFMPEMDEGTVLDVLRTLIGAYRRTLQSDRRHMLAQYRVVHMARKVVGVGSVGTQAWIVLFLDRDARDPLFLQAKEAQPSVLEAFTTKSGFAEHGQRVVMGQRLMQATSDIFLGWERVEWAGESHDYYLRQLRDWKGSVDIAGMTPAGMELWGEMCGWTLARAHARSGDRIAIAAYLGGGDVFDRAIVEFADAYADQNERDFEALKKAVAVGRVPAAPDPNAASS